MTRGNLTRVPVGTDDYTAGKLTLAGSGLSTSATWAPTPKLQDNAFCGAAVQTADRGIMMAGGHSPVRVQHCAASLSHGSDMIAWKCALIHVLTLPRATTMTAPSACQLA
jgi:hypothetical protein